jgi:Bacterial pre-peptidase C-terminal domain/Putative Ig domain
VLSPIHTHIRPRSSATLLGIGIIALVLAACGGNAPPTLQPIGDQTVEVGTEFTLEIVAGDADGDELTFSVSADSISDLTTRSHPPRFVPFGQTSAYFHWTPLAMDVGSHAVTITASDGKDRSSQTFQVTVSAGSAVPLFREPLGSGTTLDLSVSSCIELDILVEDPDSPDVDISLEDPIEDGYEFVQDDPMAGIFSWCPTAKQIEGSERYTLNLKADDRGGHIGRKKYVIVLRRELENCPGTGPVITHTPPGQQSTVLDIPITAQVSDDLGVPGQPVLYYSGIAPTDPANPDFDQFVQLLMSRTSGDALTGEYTVGIPNPVLAEPAGTVRTIYYFIEATDDDDAEGTCDHRTTAPADDVYTVDVERPTVVETLAHCEPCSGDVQCTSSMCVTLSGTSASCLDECTSPGAACTDGGSCSATAWTSVDGSSGLICLPPGSSCQGICVDDAMEDNDFLDDPGVTDLTAGTYTGLKMCDDGAGWSDEDFYALLLSDPEEVTVQILFSHSDGDLDLELVDENEIALATSDGVTDNESITACLQPGLYFVIVYSYDAQVDAAYDLVIDIPPGGCCVDDGWEPSNGALEAIPVQNTDIVDDVNICEGDVDWYQIDLQAGDTLVVDLLFDQVDLAQDLDVYFYDRDGQTNLTPCCNSTNGQSGTPDEQLTYTVNVAGTYYVVVEGYQNATNDYVIGFDVQ